MTKKEVLVELAARYERVGIELIAMQELLSLSAGHEAGVITAHSNIIVRKIRDLAKRPEMERELTFKEPV